MVEAQTARADDFRPSVVCRVKIAEVCVLVMMLPVADEQLLVCLREK